VRRRHGFAVTVCAVVIHLKIVVIVGVVVRIDVLIAILIRGSVDAIVERCGDTGWELVYYLGC